MEIYSKQNKKIILKRIKNEEIFILPTDTIYGISAVITNPDLKNKINAIKKSPKNKNLIVLVHSVKEAAKLAILTKKEISILKKHYPTTVLCNLNPDYKNKEIVIGNIIALRIVKNKFVRKIIKEVGPLFSTSANLSKNIYVGTLDSFKQLKVDFIIFDEENKNIESSIYDATIKKYIR